MATSSSTERLVRYLKKRHDDGESFVYYQGKIFSKELELPTTEIEIIIRDLVKQQRLFLFAIPGGRYLHLASKDTKFPSLRHTQIFLAICTQNIYKKDLHPLSSSLRLSVRQLRPYLIDLFESGDLQLVNDPGKGTRFEPTEAGRAKCGTLQMKQTRSCPNPPTEHEQVSVPMVSHLATVEEQIFAYIKQHQPVLFNCKTIATILRLETSVCREAVNHLISLNYLQITAFSRIGNCLMIHEALPQEERGQGLGDYMISQQNKLCRYLLTHHPVLYRPKHLAKELGWTLNDFKRLVTILQEKQLITLEGVSGVGTCLVSVQKQTQPQSEASETKPNSSLSDCLGHLKQVLIDYPSKQPTTTLYLVDTENISANQLNDGLANLSQQDRLILMKTQRTTHYEKQLKTDRCVAQIGTFHQEVNGKNALDFVIISEATRQLMHNPHQNLCIVSNDKGFDAALVHLAESLNLSHSQLSRRTDLSTAQS